MASDEDRTGTWQAYGRTAGQARSPLDDATFRDLHQAGLPQPFSLEGNRRFVEHLAAHFPEVASSIDEADLGVLHLEVGALKQATREAIEGRDWPAVARHFAFVDSMLESADTELHDAIGISYLIALFYGETSLNYAKARTLLPKRLALALEIMERHYEEQGHQR